MRVGVGGRSTAAVAAVNVRSALGDVVVRVLVIVFAVAQLLDAVTTEIAIRSGRFSEGNPLFSTVVRSHLDGAVLVKLTVAAMVLSIALAAVRSGRLRTVLAVLAAISLQAPLVNLVRLVAG